MPKSRKHALRRYAPFAGVAALGLVTGPAVTATPPKQVVTGPVATYWMDATTSSGLTLSGGQQPSMASMMGMMSGDVHHTLNLSLGSNRAAMAETHGDHLLSAGDLPLYYKREAATPREPVERDPVMHDYEPPKGKILIYWGCGERAAAGQPLVVDLAKITDPNQRMAMVKQLAPSVTLDSVRKPSPATFKAFGEWPNIRSNDPFRGDTLAGAHRIKTDFAPEIQFTLAQGQDFLAPIRISGNSPSASGAVPLTWVAIPGAKGFVVTAVGGGRDNTVVMWTSAASNTGWMGMAPDYLTPGDIERLTASKVLLPGTATACTVPAEVMNAAEGAMYTVTAYGGETNLSYPPRPEDPKVAWNIEWTTKVRYRSQTGGLLGQDMGGMGGMFGAAAQQEPPSSEPDQGGKKKKKKSGLLGEVLKQGVGSFIP